MTGGYLCVVKNPLSVSPAAKYRRLTLPSNLRFATFPFRDGIGKFIISPKVLIVLKIG